MSTARRRSCRAAIPDQEVRIGRERRPAASFSPRICGFRPQLSESHLGELGSRASAANVKAVNGTTSTS